MAYSSAYPDLNFNPRSYKRSDGMLELPQWLGSDFNPRSYKRSDSGHQGV